LHPAAHDGSRDYRRDEVRHTTKIAWRALALLEIEILAEQGDEEAIAQVRALSTMAHNEALDAALTALTKVIASKREVPGVKSNTTMRRK
jgi:hypothetical protein